MSTTPAPSGPTAIEAVSSSFTQAWQRVTLLLFTGPEARLTTWLTWGLILLLAGLSGGGSSFNIPGENDVESFGGAADEAAPAFDVESLLPFLVPAVVLVLALVLLALFVNAAFRFVALEGVVAGTPRIRGVFGRAARSAVPYAAFLLAVTLVQIAAFVVPLLPALPELRDLGSGGELTLRTVWRLLLPILFVGLPVLILGQFLRWLVHAFALPYVWLRGDGLVRASGAAARTIGSRFGAFVAFAVAYFFCAWGAAFATCLLAFCSCFIWGVPVAVMAGLAVLSIKLTPWLFVVTGPLILALGFLTGWIVATLTAPIPLFFRAWSLAFVATLDPGLAQLARAGADTPPAPPAAPHVPPPPPAPPLEPSS